MWRPDQSLSPTAGRSRWLRRGDAGIRLGSSIKADGAFHSDTEWHPHDPAETTPQLLSSLWNQIATSIDTLEQGETDTVIYPNMQAELNTRPSKLLPIIMAHFDACKDVCDKFGITCTIVPFLDPVPEAKQAQQSPVPRKITGFTVKSFRSPSKTNDDTSTGRYSTGSGDEPSFAYDVSAIDCRFSLARSLYRLP
jgi:hypothetical protein